MPGLRVIRTYRREWLQSDLLAGISLAAVALPIGIAYAELAGFPPVAGIYSAILPAVAYALFGSSRQLVVNPDAAACAIVAADPQRIAGLKAQAQSLEQKPSAAKAGDPFHVEESAQRASSSSACMSSSERPKW